MNAAIRLSLAATALLWWPGQQPPRFSSGVERVRVDVLVTRDGRPVEGLTAADFQVRDNGVVQKIDFASLEEAPLDVVLALDASESVEGQRLGQLRTATAALLGRLTTDDRAALLTFGDAVVIHSPLTLERAAIDAALREVNPTGDTALVDACETAMVLAEPRDNGRALVLVFSDGVEVSSFLDPATVRQTGRRSDAVVYGIVPKRAVQPPFLRDLAETSGGELLELASTADLSATFTRVLDQFRQRYLLSYTPAGVSGDGWHKLDVRARADRATVRARSGYTRTSRGR